MAHRAAAFGCCWPSVIKAYADIEPQASSAWMEWEGALKARCGVSMHAETCAEQEEQASEASLK
eukprot:CAMPEP_0173406158 /NCGR_PEP_ID=MMETSP1356-20130122/63831_1 /TAXON_ID=77927 ORGANISM="Hemiselmis virescens, Strain PCC157" /NCGR_SAMPLE_ID=MMETSP1356 /ASSEMBLY_ACC=CAM_ASM_000847 /LENGTH=63 /DNA_ID=CAMNT_0014367085 /DNA_START=36 /DNA_END=224 /DNA_ORIENTATION=+